MFVNKKMSKKDKVFFEKGGKFLWSYKYERCIKCNRQVFKHKGKGLCTSCWDKERRKMGNRPKSRKIAQIKWNLKRKIIKALTKIQIKKESNFNKQIYQKIWYYKKKTKKLKEKGKIPLKVYIGEKLIELPFESLERPKLIGHYRGKKEIETGKEFYKKYEEEMKQYKKNFKIFNLITNYYKNERITNKYNLKINSNKIY
ncbi:hypothetical protein D8B46_10005 [Candidatus Gracilibacteria bacterium]|nr:MAG: hypothetical protein D8B46_10005 [Candidatus Gracilibacteria bacterium]